METGHETDGMSPGIDCGVKRSEDCVPRETRYICMR